MKLQLPKQITFWISVIIAAVGVVVGAVHIFARYISNLGVVAFLFIVVAYVLLLLGLTMKGL